MPLPNEDDGCVVVESPRLSQAPNPSARSPTRKVNHRSKKPKVDEKLEPWADVEIEQLRLGIKTHGKRWETVLRSIPGRDAVLAKIFYLTFVEAGRLQAYTRMRDTEDLTHRDIMLREPKGSLDKYGPPPESTRDLALEQRATSRRVKARVKAPKKKGSKSSSKASAAVAQDHSDEEIVVVGQGDDIMFHQSSTSYMRPAPEPQSLDLGDPPDIVELVDVTSGAASPPKRSHKRKAAPEAAETWNARTVGHAVAVPARSRKRTSAARKRSKGEVTPRSGESNGDIGFTGMPADGSALAKSAPLPRLQHPHDPSGQMAVVRTPDAVTLPNVEHRQPQPATRMCYCGEDRALVFFVACDGCDTWFHGSCVGVDPNFVTRLEGGGIGYYCTQCAIKRDHGATVHSTDNGEWAVSRKANGRTQVEDTASGTDSPSSLDGTLPDDLQDDADYTVESNYGSGGASSREDDVAGRTKSRRVSSTVLSNPLQSKSGTGKVVHVTRFSRDTMSLRARTLSAADCEHFQSVAKKRRFFTRIGWPRESVPGPVQGVPYGPSPTKHFQQAGAVEPPVAPRLWSESAASFRPPGFRNLDTGIGGGAPPMRAALDAQGAYQSPHGPSSTTSPPVAAAVVPSGVAPQVIQYSGADPASRHAAAHPAVPYGAYATPPAPTTSISTEGEYPPLICVPQITELVPQAAVRGDGDLILGPMQSPPGAVMQETFEPATPFFRSCGHGVHFPCANLTAKRRCHWHDDARVDVDIADAEMDDRDALLHHVQRQCQRELQRYASTAPKAAPPNMYAQPQMNSWHPMAMMGAYPHPMQVMVPQIHPQWMAPTQSGFR